MKNYKKNNKDKNIYFLPLGGSGEIGMNFNMYGFNDEWLIVDCGVTFKDHQVMGADVFMPNIDIIEKNKFKISGLLITHAHEDHIGAVHHLWPYLKCPIYLTPFSAHLLKQRLIDFGLLEQAKVNIVEKQSKFNIGGFRLELINISHSILEPNSVLISIGGKKIFHTGDWKLDESPNIGSKTNTKRLKEIGNEGVDAIICDSTNANVSGNSGSEKSIEKGITKYIKNYKGRIFITMFASNVERILTLIRLAKENSRQVGLIGRSMWRMTNAASEVGYLDKNISLLNEKKLNNLEDNKFLSICTGSQGEPLGALNRIINDMHNYISFKKGDRVIFSSRMIPGNEVGINNLINKLIYKGVDVVVPKFNNIHVSGHPAQEELETMYSWIKPKISIPVHGEAIHIQAHANLAKKCGVEEVVKIKNGFLVEINNNSAKVIKKYETGKVALNGEELISTDASIFKERKKMLFNGTMTVTLIFNESGDLQELPRLNMLAVLTTIRDYELKSFSEYLEASIHDFIPFNISKENDLKVFIKRKVKRYMSNKYDKNPSIIVDIIYIGE